MGSIVVYGSAQVGIANDVTTEKTGKSMIALILPKVKSEQPFPDVPSHGENFDYLFFTVPAAKSILVDLRNMMEKIELELGEQG